LWVGEYGIFETGDDKLDVLRRFAAAQDADLSGGAVWQWRQHCGEPHTVGTPGNVADGRVVQLNFVDCPGDRDGGANVRFLRIVGRVYPRAPPPPPGPAGPTCPSSASWVGPTRGPRQAS